VSKRFSVTVDGIDDGDLVLEIEAAVRQSFAELALPGTWQVSVMPSQVGGRWDFFVAGLDVHHRLSIAVPPQSLPGLIPERLVDSLNRIVRERTESTAERVIGLQQAG
jgi:hypothetical protein